MENTIVKPNLIIPGAGKSGSSSLHEYLNLHPDVFMSKEKEPHYFSHDKIFKEKQKYYQLFENTNKFIYRGESSTGYMVLPKSIDRIIEEIGSPKLIFILRNPIDRCFSHYHWVRSFKAEAKSLRSAVEQDMYEEPFPESGFGMGYKYYFQFGLYGKWIEKFVKAFGLQNIHIITTERLRSDKLNALNEIFAFLNIKALKSVPEIKSNATKYYGSEIVLFYYLNSFKRIYKILNPRTEYWLKRSPIIKKLNNVLNNPENMLKTRDKPMIRSEDRTWLTGLYSSDVQNLKEISGKAFKEWRDFT